MSTHDRDTVNHGSARRWPVALLAALTLALAASATNAKPGDYNFGQPATQTEINAWNVDVSPDGDNLPQGSGSVSQGQQVFAANCSACHGAQGQGGPMDRLVGGVGTLNTDKPVKTIGSYWPYAATVVDYIRRTMPFNRPGTLTNDQVYAVTAYLLYLNGIADKSAVMNAKTLARVKMPNQADFIRRDPRPDAP
ncbi:MAG: c-type cytochrome [Vulcanimicrobiaceae bacterium]